MAVYSPGDVEISTTISIGVIGVMVMVILFYLWLCAVSLYQSLKEIQNLGSDQVKRALAVMVIMMVMLVIMVIALTFLFPWLCIIRHYQKEMENWRCSTSIGEAHLKI